MYTLYIHRYCASVILYFVLKVGSAKNPENYL